MENKENLNANCHKTNNQEQLINPFLSKSQNQSFKKQQTQKTSTPKTLINPTSQFDYSLEQYKNEILPKFKSVIATQVCINSSLQERTLYDEKVQFLYDYLKQKLQHQLTQQDLRQQQEMNVLLNEYQTFKKQNSEKLFQLSDAQQKLQSLIEKKKEVQSKHAEISQNFQQLQKNRETQVSEMKSIQELNQMLKEKNQTEKTLLNYNDQRLKRCQNREGDLYFHYQKYLNNRRLEIKGNIRVFCRVRPILPEDHLQIMQRQSIAPPMLNGIKSKKRIEELKINFGKQLLNKNSSAKEMTQLSQLMPIQEDTIVVKGEHSLEVRQYNPNQNSYAQLLPGQSEKLYQASNFKFDRVFGVQDSQEDVFNEVRDVVRAALDGFKVCIFAYGQTGAGKTYTMEGGSTFESMGLVPRSVKMVFDTLETYDRKEWEFIEVSLSCVEIHIETVRDLLNPQNETNQIMTNNQKFKLAEIAVQEFKDVEYLLNKARENRKVSSTALNAQSSRSHCIYQLKIKAKRKGQPQLEGALNLVDLAGSERIQDSKVEGDRLKETQSINKSLSCLGDVIAAIIKKETHIPYRNSKLTALLSNYLGGDSKTLMVVNISPLQCNAFETLTSLKFASKVNICKIESKKMQGLQSVNSSMNE
eukprot:403355048